MNAPHCKKKKSYKISLLAQIVETMSFSEDVASFMHVLGPFYEIVYDGQEPENLRRNSSPDPSELEKDQQEDESGYSSSINGTGTEEAGKLSRSKGAELGRSTLAYRAIAIRRFSSNKLLGKSSISEIYSVCFQLLL